MILPWWLTAVASSFCLVAIEYFYRSAGDSSYLKQGVYCLPLVFCAQWALFETFKDRPGGASSLFLAWMTISFSNVVLRAAVAQFLLDEPLNHLTGAGILCMMAAVVLVKLGS